MQYYCNTVGNNTEQRQLVRNDDKVGLTESAMTETYNRIGPKLDIELLCYSPKRCYTFVKTHNDTRLSRPMVQNDTETKTGRP